MNLCAVEVVTANIFSDTTRAPLNRTTEITMRRFALVSVLIENIPWLALTIAYHLDSQKFDVFAVLSALCHIVEMVSAFVGGFLALMLRPDQPPAIQLQ